MRARRSYTLLRAALVAMASARVLFGSPAPAQAQAPETETQVVCVVNETGEALSVWLREPAEAHRPLAAFGGVPDRQPHCYRRDALQGYDAAVLLGEALDPWEIETADVRERHAAEMRAFRDQPPVCEVSTALFDQVDFRRRRTVVVRVFRNPAGNTCAASVSVVPRDWFAAARVGQ